MNRRNMEPTSSAIGLIVIVAVYITIGVMSAAGSVYIAKSIFSAKAEQIFFGLFLIPIAGFYLAFTAYFEDKDAWPLEATAVAAVAVFRPSGSPSSICCHIDVKAIADWQVHKDGRQTNSRHVWSRQSSPLTTNGPLDHR
jgi:hypothetical protein